MRPVFTGQEAAAETGDRRDECTGYVAKIDIEIFEPAVQFPLTTPSMPDSGRTSAARGGVLADPATGVSVNTCGRNCPS